MKRLSVALAALAVLSACTTTPTPPDENVDSYAPPPRVERPQDMSYRINLQDLQSRLRMTREADDLGFTEKQFDTCVAGLSSGSCSRKYFSVVHFQLLCRDSEGSVSEAPVQLTPLTSDRVTWKIAAHTGNTQTDGQGYGRFLMLSEKSVRGQRLTLRIGRRFMGFTVSDVSKVVLPRNFCE
jgi:hypothetical protein